MTVAEKMMLAMTSRGYGLRTAWIMARASYAYTRSFDGTEIDDAGNVISFGRWYAFKGAAELFWEYLWRRDAPENQ